MPARRGVTPGQFREHPFDVSFRPLGGRFELVRIRDGVKAQLFTKRAVCGFFIRCGYGEGTQNPRFDLGRGEPTKMACMP